MGLFNIDSHAAESLKVHNHVYSYIFSKLDDNGKLELTRYSIECERKLR